MYTNSFIYRNLYRKISFFNLKRLLSTHKYSLIFGSPLSNSPKWAFRSYDLFWRVQWYSSYKHGNPKQIDILRNKIINSDLVISEERVNEIKRSVFSMGSTINENNFDTIFLQTCRNEKTFSLGKDFFHFLYSRSNRNVAVIGKFLRLCYDFSAECSNDDKLFIVTLYKEVLKNYPILDSITCENAALGLSITNSWKEGLQLLEMCKYSNKPSSKMYSSIIESAFRNKEFNTANSLLIEMVINKLNPHLGVYKSWMEATDFNEDSYFEILCFLEKYGIHPSEELADLLLIFHKQVKTSIKTMGLTTIHSRGICQKCFKPLKPVTLTEEEFIKLKEAFLDPVLIGKDVFLKSKPDELNSFLRFVDRVGKVDVVLDGLNIAFSKDHRNTNRETSAKLLCAVVRHFVNQSKRVVVLGRKHMAIWPEKHMFYIKKHCPLFLADNMSADDPLLLYTAMKSGLNTFFVSRDQMRGHKFLLKNAELISIFTRWQQMHQYYLQYISPKGDVKFVEPVPYLLNAQESAHGTWHIPISTSMEGVPAHLVIKKTKWLCLS